jgi:FixJ family two-component response regulator
MIDANSNSCAFVAPQARHPVGVRPDCESRDSRVAPRPLDEPKGDEVPIVFVVEDDPGVRESVGNLVRSIGLRVRAFSSPAEFRDQRPPSGPSCLVLDIGLPGKSGMDIQRELIGENHPWSIVFITGRGEIPTVVKAIKAGAIAFLTKPLSAAELLDAIQLAVEENRRTLSQHLESVQLQARYETLTAREREVMSLIVQGRMNKEVAMELRKSEVTVKTQRGRVMRKMRADSLAELVRFAERLERGKLHPWSKC